MSVFYRTETRRLMIATQSGDWTDSTTWTDPTTQHTVRATPLGRLLLRLTGNRWPVHHVTAQPNQQFVVDSGRVVISGTLKPIAGPSPAVIVRSGHVTTLGTLWNSPAACATDDTEPASAAPAPN